MARLGYKEGKCVAEGDGCVLAWLTRSNRMCERKWRSMLKWGRTWDFSSGGDGMNYLDSNLEHGAKRERGGERMRIILIWTPSALSSYWNSNLGSNNQLRSLVRTNDLRSSAAPQIINQALAMQGAESRPSSLSLYLFPASQPVFTFWNSSLDATILLCSAIMENV